MDQTFIAIIQNLEHDANIQFASESIKDILGYAPENVMGRSCFDYFHPDEEYGLRQGLRKGINMDKAAVLHYCRIRRSDGEWVCCECCFTVVSDVLVACISVYHHGVNSQKRAADAPQVQRIFSSAPRDPRYYMLEHLSQRFRANHPAPREPRAALILNRFTRSLNIMHATDDVSAMLGISPDELMGKSFYECIHPNCHRDATNCLEGAKLNESIAYLRFWFQDPTPAPRPGEAMERDSPVNGDSDVDSDSGGARLSEHMDVDLEPGAAVRQNQGQYANGVAHPGGQGRANDERGGSAGANSPGRRNIELEAVVSCSSDGLVVVLRPAQASMPVQQPQHAALPQLQGPVGARSGIFAAPWAAQAIRPHEPAPEQLYNFQAPLVPHHMPVRDEVRAAGGPPMDQLMRSIGEIAVFAWALVGINGSLASYGRGVPHGEAQPEGLPIYDPVAAAAEVGYLGPENQAAIRWGQMGDAYNNGRSPREMRAVNGGFGGNGFGQQSAGYMERRTNSHSIQLHVPAGFGQNGHNGQHYQQLQQGHNQQYGQQEQGHVYHHYANGHAQHPQQQAYNQHQYQQQHQPQQQQHQPQQQQQDTPRDYWPSPYAGDGGVRDAMQQRQAEYRNGQHNGASGNGMPTTQPGDSGYSSQSQFGWQ